MKAALAAGEQDRFWNFLQLFYLNQGGENSGYVTDGFLTSIAKGAGVPDIDKWNHGSQRLEVGRDDPAGQLPGGLPRLHRHAVDPRAGPEGPEGDRRLTIPTLEQVQAAIQQVS